MKRKAYKAPAVKRVRLVIKDSVLASCNQSPNLDAKVGNLTCKSTGCYTP